MSTLHTLSSSWHECTWIFEQICFATEGDAILLIEDAVLAAHSPLTLASFLAKCEARGVSAYVLQNDLLLRGINNQYEKLKVTDYDGFVELTDKHNRQVAW